MVEREVVWSDTALFQFKFILAYWKDKNKSNAFPEKILRQVSRQIALITKFPYLAPSVSETDFRRSILGNYSLIYEITPNQIYVVYFWDDRQDPLQYKKAIMKLIK